MKIRKRNLLIFLLIPFFIYGCSPILIEKQKNNDSGKALKKIELEKEKKGFYHIVKEKQTLSDISKIYNLNVESIIEVNQLPDGNKIDVGQMIYIPDNPEFYGNKDDFDGKDVFFWPANGKVISLFSSRESDYNPGIDIKISPGTDIKSAAQGNVIFAGGAITDPGNNIILIRHSDVYTSVYVFSGEMLVKQGDFVRKSQVIFQGSDTENILHFEIRKYHLPRNPYFYLP